MRAEVEEPGNRSIDIRMWSPRTFRRILAFEISLSPNLNLVLESSSTSLGGIGLPLKGMRKLRSVRYQCVVPSINGEFQKLVEDHRSPNSERHSVNDPHQRSVGQRNLALPYITLHSV
jgi:hypothetical protein